MGLGTTWALAFALLFFYAAAMTIMWRNCWTIIERYKANEVINKKLFTNLLEQFDEVQGALQKQNDEQ
jgi:hypothetical protein